MVKQKLADGKKDLRNNKIKLKATDAHPYIEEGKVYSVHPVHKDTLLARQWAVEENSKNTKAENPVGLKETDNLIQTGNKEPGTEKANPKGTEKANENKA